LEWGKEVEVIYKEYDLAPGVGMRDIEDGRLNELQYDEWINDMGIGLPTNWWYFESINYKPTNWLVDEFVDMVSKNGRLLLNVGPKPDGTFHKEAQKRLIEFGEWLNINKEAFFGTSAWVIYGEGPTEIKELPLNHFANDEELDFDKLEELRKVGKIITGHYSQDVEINYQPQDIRFTVKGNTLYATCLGWPGEKVVIESLGSRGALLKGEIKRVAMLGVDEELLWDHKPEGLVITTPAKKPCDHAFAFKIERN
jgi:alpha-L-fucosidase